MSKKVAVIQKPPVLLNKQATIDRVLDSIEEAVGEGAELLVFPEAYIPGYPTWGWRLRPGGDMALSAEIHAKLRENAVDLARGELQALQDAARKHGICVVLGISELDSQFSGTTLFNTVVVIGPGGEILNRHRKLMPTNPERMIWGPGDGSGLRVVDTPAGRLGTLICWEAYMPLARYALYAQDIEIFVFPTWDTSETWQASMRHVAMEGGCWVISTGTAIQGGDVPEDFPERDTLFDDEEWINVGNAMVVKPMGEVVAGPLHKEKGILYAEIDKDVARRARRSFDVSGHYARADMLSLSVDRRPLEPVNFSD